jgi:hypothetical protein
LLGDRSQEESNERTARDGFDQRPHDLSASVFWTSREEVVVDRPAEDVWAVLNDQDLETVQEWNPTVVGVERTSGLPGEVGEFVLLTKNTDQSPFTMRTVRSIPNHQRVLRIDSIDRSYCGFVDHSLYPLDDGRTRVVYNGYLEFRTVPASDLDGRISDEAAQASMEYLSEGSAC